ncbi:MAG TPA: hypothetical protein VF220_10180 [Nitrososphaeraceae archaeon]
MINPNANSSLKARKTGSDGEYQRFDIHFTHSQDDKLRVIEIF